MAHAVRFYETGGPDVLNWEEVTVGDPGPGEVRIRHVAVGLNFADTYFRTGLYPVRLPDGIGVEASGVIEAVGDGVTHVTEGDRVTYTGSPLGAYSTERVMPASHLIKLPDGIGFETAAAMTMRGLTSAYLLRRIHPLKAGDTVLLHAAAGGVGLIVSQWARLLGVTVIGTVSSEEKAELARAHGCEHIIHYRRENVAERVRELTDGSRRAGRLRQCRQGHLSRLAGLVVAARTAGLLRHGLRSRATDRCHAARRERIPLRHPSCAGRLHRRTGGARRPCR